MANKIWQPLICIIDSSNRYLEKYEKLYRHQNYDVVGSTDYNFFFQLNREEHIDLLVLLLPENHENELYGFLGQIHRLNFRSGIMVVVDGDYDAYVLKLFEQGCDECVCDCYNEQEILYRSYAVLKRTNAFSERLVYDKLTLIPSKRLLLINNKPIPVTLQEIRIIEEFFRAKEHFLTRTYLAHAIWKNIHLDVKTINTSISRLNQKLLPYIEDKLLLSVRGVGYILNKQAV